MVNYSGKYLPKNINTDSENNSCSNKQEQRENIYRELIKPENNSEIITKLKCVKTED